MIVPNIRVPLRARQGPFKACQRLFRTLQPKQREPLVVEYPRITGVRLENLVVTGQCLAETPQREKGAALVEEEIGVPGGNGEGLVITGQGLLEAPSGLK